MEPDVRITTQSSLCLLEVIFSFPLTSLQYLHHPPVCTRGFSNLAFNSYRDLKRVTISPVDLVAIDIWPALHPAAGAHTLDAILGDDLVVVDRVANDGAQVFVADLESAVLDALAADVAGLVVG